MLEASAQHDMVTFYQELGYILQICYDFESYKTTAASLVEYTKNASRRPNQLKGVAPTEQRVERRLKETRERAE